MKKMCVVTAIVILQSVSTGFSQVALGSAQLMYSDAQLPTNDPMNGSFNIDATFATLRNTDGTISLFYNNSQGVTKYVGTLNNLLGTAPSWSRVSAKSVRDCTNGLFTNYPDCYKINGTQQDGGRINFYMPSIYSIDGTRLLAFTHIEDARNGNCNSGDLCPGSQTAPGQNWFYDIHIRYGIGIAYSSDGGSKWTICNRNNTSATTADISIINSGIASTGLETNIGGVPYIIRNGYFYIYFNERFGGGSILSVARAPVAEVISNAESGRLTDWKKFDGNKGTEDGFNVDGRTGTGVNIIPSFSQYPNNTSSYYDFHSDAVYSTTYKRYFITVNCTRNQASGSGKDALLMYSSSDGVDWKLPPTVIDARPGSYYVYSTFLAESNSSADYSEVGSKFHILYPIKPWPAPPPPPAAQTGPNTDHDDVYLRKITIPLTTQSISTPVFLK